MTVQRSPINPVLKAPSPGPAAPSAQAPAPSGTGKTADGKSVSVVKPQTFLNRIASFFSATQSESADDRAIRSVDARAEQNPADLRQLAKESRQLIVAAPSSQKPTGGIEHAGPQALPESAVLPEGDLAAPPLSSRASVAISPQASAPSPSTSNPAYKAALAKANQLLLSNPDPNGVFDALVSDYSAPVQSLGDREADVDVCVRAVIDAYQGLHAPQGGEGKSTASSASAQSQHPDALASQTPSEKPSPGQPHGTRTHEDAWVAKMRPWLQVSLVTRHSSEESIYDATKNCATKIFAGSVGSPSDVPKFLDRALDDFSTSGLSRSSVVMVVKGLVDSLGGASIQAEHAKALVSWVNAQSNQEFKLDVFKMLGQVVGAEGADSSKTQLHQTVSRELSRSSFFPSPRARQAACLATFKEAQLGVATQQMLSDLKSTRLPGVQTPPHALS